MSEVTAKDFRDAVFTAFATAWDGETEIAAPNVWFDMDSKDEWVRLYLLGDRQEDGHERLSHSAARNHWVRSGVLTIEIYVKKDADLDRAYALAERSLKWLENTGVAQAVFTNPRGPIEEGPDGTWFQVTVAADWRYFTDRAA